MECEKIILGICFVPPTGSLESSIFGFAEFIAALALLVIVYTISDVRYRFRVAVAPARLFGLTYFLIGGIGFGTLLTDIWITERWLVPVSLISLTILQGLFGAFFLLIAMTWIYYAFINPPIFCEKNDRKFANKLYWSILKGSDTELPIIASELARSTDSLVKLTKRIPSRRENNSSEEGQEKNHKLSVGDFAYDILLLIGNRKLCRHIIISSPKTAIFIFEDMTINKKYDIPIGQFAKNISTEAITNKDSLFYHEDDGYSSGLIGYLKPFSQAIYGNFQLVDTLGLNDGSPLDIDYEIRWSWDASQLEAYSRAVLITWKSYLESGNWYQHSFALFRAFNNMKESFRDVYKLNDISSDYYSTDIYKRLEVAVKFSKDAINYIDELENPPSGKLRTSRDQARRDFYDYITDFMYEVILSASSVTSPPDKCWGIHYNAVWTEFFNISDDGKAWRIILSKLRRMLYDEILRLEELPNYQSSRILGICLNVMGVKMKPVNFHIDKYYRPLHAAVLSWTKRHFLRMRNMNPDVADSCLIGSISFDEQNSRLVKTYIKGLHLEAPKEYLELDMPPERSSADDV